MIVSYDFQIFVNQKFGGISRYFYEIINYFISNQTEVKIKLPFIISQNFYLYKFIREDKSKNFNYIKTLQQNFKGKQRLLTFINRHYDKYFLKYGAYDLFHPTYYNPYFLKYIGKKPFVLTVYDMIHERFSEYFPTKDKTSEYKKILSQKANKIIAISQNTKNDLIELFGISENKINVIYLASSFSKEDLDKHIEISERVPKNYILFVGRRSGYKNFNRFAKAFSILVKKYSDLHLVCVGGGRFSKLENKFLKDLGIEQLVHQYDLTDEKLVWFYKNALLFVFPSLYEGFGIPILEAFSCQCPVVCSNSSSFPEIAKEAALYFDPHDEEAMVDAIEKVINDFDLREQMVTLGIERLKHFSWEITAKKTKAIYLELVE